MHAYMLSHFSRVQVCATLWTVSCQGLLSMGFSRQEYWSGLPRLPPKGMKWQPTPVFLPGETQGWGSLVGCRQWGRTESDTTEAT